MATALAQLNLIHAGQQAYTTIIATMPPCTVKSCFVCGFPSGDSFWSADLWGFCGPRGAPATATRAKTNPWHHTMGTIAAMARAMTYGDRQIGLGTSVRGVTGKLPEGATSRCRTPSRGA
jgi:hypothetical protein